MASLSQLIAYRQTAGARYAAAVTELIAAMVDLKGLDLALENEVVAYRRPSQSFGPPPDVISLRHAEFAPDVACDWHKEFMASLASHTRTFPTPDA